MPAELKFSKTVATSRFCRLACIAVFGLAAGCGSQNESVSTLEPQTPTITETQPLLETALAQETSTPESEATPTDSDNPATEENQTEIWNENTSYIDDYYGLGPAEITLVTESEDWTQSYLDGTRSFPEDEVLILDQNGSVVQGVGVIDITSINGITISNYVIERVVVNNPTFGRLESHQVSVRGVYMLDGELHVLNFAILGQVGFGARILSAKDFEKAFSLGTTIILYPEHIEPSNTTATNAKYLDYLIQKTGGKPSNDPDLMIILGGFGDGRATTNDLRLLLQSPEATLSSETYMTSIIRVLKR